MKYFKVLWTLNAVAASVVVLFFFIGLADGTVSSFNILLWLGILLALGLILAGSKSLMQKGKKQWAIILVSLLALPVVLFLLFFTAVIFSGGRWN